MANAGKVTIVLCLLLLGSMAAQSQERPIKVVTSIKPIALLVRAVAPESTQITTLVPAGASPHTYQMRPSDRRALAEADFIFWVGADLEIFLQRIMANREFSSRAHALMPAGAIARADNHKSLQTKPEHGHHHTIDPHVWLDPELALKMATGIRDQLSGYPDIEKKELDARLKRFRIALQQKEKSIRKALTPMDSVSIFTYHDALKRFASYYDLKITGSLTPSPESSPGARHINEIQQQLRQADAPCLMTEPQFNRDWWRNLTENVDVRLSVWDPLASDIPETADGYIRFQQSVAEALSKCIPD